MLTGFSLPRWSPRRSTSRSSRSVRLPFPPRGFETDRIPRDCHELCGGLSWIFFFFFHPRHGTIFLQRRTDNGPPMGMQAPSPSGVTSPTGSSVCRRHGASLRVSTTASADASRARLLCHPYVYRIHHISETCHLSDIRLVLSWAVSPRNDHPLEIIRDRC